MTPVLPLPKAFQPHRLYICLLKIDVGGVEFETLAGAERMISQHKPQMLIEAIIINGEKIRCLHMTGAMMFSGWTGIFSRCIEPMLSRQSGRLMMGF